MSGKASDLEGSARLSCEIPGPPPQPQPKHPLDGFEVDSAGRTLFDALWAASENVSLVLLDGELRLQWINEAHRRLLKERTGRDYDNAPDENCFRAWNGFDKACTWCPVTLSLEDGMLHRGRSASPANAAEPALRYADIVAVPLTPTSSSNKLVLEIVFPTSDRPYDRLRISADLGEQLGALLHHTGNPKLFVDILALFLFAAVGGITRTRAYYYEASSPQDDDPIIADSRKLSRDDLEQELDPKFLASLSECTEEIPALWARFFAQEEKTRPRLSELLEPEIVRFLPPYDWVPVRVSPNALSFRVPCRMGGTTKTAHWLVIAENTKSDTFLLQEHRTQTALFLASVRRQADLLETRLRENALAIATQKKLDMLNNPEIVDVVPFALGLGHDLGHLVGRLNRELHLLTHLDLPATAALQLKGINGVAKSLSHIKGSLASFAALKTPKFEQTRIGEVLDRTLEYAVDLTRRPGITIQAHYRASQVITLRGDSGLLAQLFFNLIDNATKELMFVRYRVPTLAISSRCSPDGFAEVDFRDNGYGIDDADLPRIFERYFSRTGGTGLGLYYSKVIAKVHGGDITLNTKSGDGSTFTVRLPI